MESEHKALLIIKKPPHRALKRLQRMLLTSNPINLGYRKGSTMYLTGALNPAYLHTSRVST